MDQTKIAERVARRHVRASWDGLFLWQEDTYITVWASMDSYGRVHHVTKDIREAEQRLEASRKRYLDAFIASGIRYDLGEITIDGVKGSGRNPMMMYYTVSWPRGTDPKVLDNAIVAGYWGIKTMRRPPK